MLEKIASLYRKAELGLIGGLAGDTAGVIDEAGFYDAGYLEAQIERIKKDLDRTTADLRAQAETDSGSETGKRRQAELMARREELLFHMVFLASNNPAKLEACEELAGGRDWAFMACIRGLRAYRDGRQDEAFRLLEGYYRQKGGVKGHFLANKAFGLLLAERELYEKAVPFLTYALQLLPGDRACLEGLSLCYRRIGNRARASVADEILALLGGAE